MSESAAGRLGNIADMHGLEPRGAIAEQGNHGQAPDDCVQRSEKRPVPAEHGARAQDGRGRKGAPDLVLSLGPGAHIGRRRSPVDADPGEVNQMPDPLGLHDLRHRTRPFHMHIPERLRARLQVEPDAVDDGARPLEGVGQAITVSRVKLNQADAAIQTVGGSSGLFRRSRRDNNPAPLLQQPANHPPAEKSGAAKHDHVAVAHRCDQSSQASPSHPIMCRNMALCEPSRSRRRPILLDTKAAQRAFRRAVSRRLHPFAARVLRAGRARRRSPLSLRGRDASSAGSRRRR